MVVRPPPASAQPAVTVAQRAEVFVVEHGKWQVPGFSDTQTFEGTLNRPDGTLRQVVDVSYHGAGLCVDLQAAPFAVPALSDAPYNKLAGKGVLRSCLQDDLKVVHDARLAVGGLIGGRERLNRTARLRIYRASRPMYPMLPNDTPQWFRGASSGEEDVACSASTQPSASSSPAPDNDSSQQWSSEGTDEE